MLLDYASLLLLLLIALNLTAEMRWLMLFLNTHTNGTTARRKQQTGCLFQTLYVCYME